MDVFYDVLRFSGQTKTLLRFLSSSHQNECQCFDYFQEDMIIFKFG